MPKYVENYGAFGTNRNEIGQRCTPKPVWGSVDHSGMARSNFGFETRLDLTSMINDFIASNGKKPTVLHVTDRSAAKALGKSYAGAGFVGLTIIPGADNDRLE